MVAHTLSLSTGETEVGRFLWIQGQPGLHCEFQAGQGYIVRACLRQKKKEVWQACSSVVEHVPNMYETLSPIFNTPQEV